MSLFYVDFESRLSVISGRDLREFEVRKMPPSQYGLPMVVSQLGADVPALGLKRVQLSKGGLYDEAWLQQIIMQHPGLLPIQQIEPAFIPAIPICMELGVPSGFIDNLYATPTGDLIVGETKLFRNPESRREVIGQIIDYAKDLSAWSYAELDAAVRKSRPARKGESKGVGLFAAVKAATGAEEIEEARFIDAVSRNLSRGRFLLLVIGDGIQEGIEGISGFLQRHAQLHFTFGLVELTIFELPSLNAAPSGFLIQPRIIARTLNVERGIFAIEKDQIVLKPPQTHPARTTPTNVTITEERFFEELELVCPGITTRLQAFTARLEDLNVYVDFGTKSLILRWRPDEGRVWNLASITTSGKVWMEYLHAQADQLGLLGLSHQYLEDISKAVPGASVKRTPKPTAWYVANKGTSIMIDDLLAQPDGWYAAISKFTAATLEALSAH